MILQSHDPVKKRGEGGKGDAGREERELNKKKKAQLSRLAPPLRRPIASSSAPARTPGQWKLRWAGHRAARPWSVSFPTAATQRARSRSQVRRVAAQTSRFLQGSGQADVRA